MSELANYKNIPSPPNPPNDRGFKKGKWEKFVTNYKWKSLDLVPNQTEEELIELNEYMKRYEEF